MLAKGWFKIDGVQDGERTLEEQLKGIEPALATCSGKTVLDFGCAEGLISRAFLERGAASAFGFDSNAELIERARSLSLDLDPARIGFSVCNLNGIDTNLHDYAEADIVLALAIVHKLREPGLALERFAGLARERLVLRLPGGSVGVIHYKHDPSASCDARKVMKKAGFQLTEVLEGPRREQVQHWCRTV